MATGGPTVQSYNHAIAVTDDGTVVLMYYDDRNNIMGDGIATTDVWLRHSQDGGQTPPTNIGTYGIVPTAGPSPTRGGTGAAAPDDDS